jgi:hypothetical protein
MTTEVSKPGKWTHERIEEVRQLTAKGYNSRQIGDKVGATRNAIVSIWRRFGIDQVRTRNRWDEASVARVARLLDDQCSYAEVAAEFGVSIATISNVVSQHRLRPRKPKLQTFTMKAPDLGAAIAFDNGPFKPVFAEGFAGQTGRLAMADLADNHCRFPIDQPDGSVRFCAQNRQRGSAYCAAHHARCTDGPAVVFRASRRSL